MFDFTFIWYIFTNSVSRPKIIPLKNFILLHLSSFFHITRFILILFLRSLGSLITSFSLSHLFLYRMLHFLTSILSKLRRQNSAILDWPRRINIAIGVWLPLSPSIISSSANLASLPLSLYTRTRVTLGCAEFYFRASGVRAPHSHIHTYADEEWGQLSSISLGAPAERQSQPVHPSKSPAAPLSLDGQAKSISTFRLFLVLPRGSGKRRVHMCNAQFRQYIEARVAVQLYLHAAACTPKKEARAAREIGCEISWEREKFMGCEWQAGENYESCIFEFFSTPAFTCVCFLYFLPFFTVISMSLYS